MAPLSILAVGVFALRSSWTVQDNVGLRCSYWPRESDYSAWVAWKIFEITMEPYCNLKNLKIKKTSHYKIT